MTILGITGGSGAGKTTLLKRISNLGGLCIDCDALYHRLLAEDAEMNRAILKRFPSVSSADGIDRKKLGTIVFADASALNELNRITHQFVKKEVQKIIESTSESLIAIDAIGLFESGLDRLCHYTVAVTAPREDRCHRLMAREGISKEYATSRIDAQPRAEEFARRCNYHLENNSSYEEFVEICDKFLKGVIPMEEKKYEALRKELLHNPKNGYDRISEEDLAAMEPYCKEYMDFISVCKTERETVDWTIEYAEKNGFKALVPGMELKPGDKVYGNCHGKLIIFAVIGTEPLNNGTHICAAHTDSPRLDLKPNPMYEDSEMAFFRTHYYGGIKKYQWTTTPLALHGVVVKKDRSVVKVTIGEDPSDPILCITDLLIHLSADQLKKPMAEGITGEGLRVLLGTRPLKGDEGGDRVKFAIMCLLNEKYGITEEDFLSAELTMVPAGPAREVGLDRSLIAAYGHDDRVCAYAAFKPLFEIGTPTKTAICVLADKEEVGSNGISGMQSEYFETFMGDLCKATGNCLRRCFENSFCLSADVSNAYDPLYGETCEKSNNTRVNYGTGIFKYTGSRGKGGSSDAAAEVMGYVRKLFADNDVIWQTGELGKVDQGGGGTVALFMANRNIETVDAGVPVLSMHAPMELVSKLDTYMTYKGMKVFYLDK